MSAFARYDMKGALTETLSEYFGHPGLFIRRLSRKASHFWGRWHRAPRDDGGGPLRLADKLYGVLLWVEDREPLRLRRMLNDP